MQQEDLNRKTMGQMKQALRPCPVPMKVKESGAVAGEEKHLKIYNAIENLDSVIWHLTELVGQIKGFSPEAGDAEEPEKKIPTLVEILDGAPELIDKKIEEAHKLIDHITALLF